MAITVITADMAGCWFAGSSNRTADELNVAVIDVALQYGWAPKDAESLADLNPEGWFEDETLSLIASDAALDAENYLNGVAPNGYVFTFDDGFYLYPVCELDGYEVDADYPCPHGEGCSNGS